jgi:phosphatidylglycerol:prolipoprotein diacylglycerol transferase
MAWPIDPVIFRIGSLQITWYALVYLLGFISITFTLSKAAKNKDINLKQEEVYDLMTSLLLGMLIGARLFHVIFWDFTYFQANPSEILKIWKGGMSFHGGLLGIFLTAFIYTKKKKISFLKLADIIVVPTTLFLALARITNYINHEILGKITTSKFCVEFPKIEGCRHPVQLYAAAGKFILFFILLKLKTKKHKSGFIFAVFLTLLGVGRFFLDFLREDMLYLSLSAGQWLSIITTIMGIYLIVKIKKVTFSSSHS